MESRTRKSSIVGGLVWSFLERIVSQLVSTVVSIILARILLPEEYGIIAIVLVFISLGDVLVVSGFGSALVQKKNVDDVDYHTAFILSCLIAVFLYLILFLCAPWIAKSYEIPSLCALLRVLGIRLIVSSYNSIQQAYIRRKMEFRRFFIATVWGTIASGVMGIAAAFAGWGAWALVLQYLTNSVVNTALTYRVCKWKPKFVFSIDRAKEIYGFGWKVLCTQLVSTLGTDIRSLIVGKVFGSEELAYFDHGKKYPALLINNVNSTLNKVMLPAFARKQDELHDLKLLLRRAISLGMYIIAPLLIGLFAVADTFVIVLLTEKWSSAIPYLRIFCVVLLLRPLEEMNHQAVIAIGRSDIGLKVMILLNTIIIASVLVSAFIFESVFAMACLTLLDSLASIICFSFSTKKLLNYRIKEQIHDVLPSVACAIAMGVIVMQVKYIAKASVVLLILQVVVGMAVYLLMSKMFKLDQLLYLAEKAKGIIRKKQNS